MLIGQKRIYNDAFIEKGLDNVILWDVQKVMEDSHNHIHRVC
jgi:hypothetical protein